MNRVEIEEMSALLMSSLLLMNAKRCCSVQSIGKKEKIAAVARKCQV